MIVGGVSLEVRVRFLSYCQANSPSRGIFFPERSTRFSPFSPYFSSIQSAPISEAPPTQIFPGLNTEHILYLRGIFHEKISFLQEDFLEPKLVPSTDSLFIFFPLSDR